MPHLTHTLLAALLITLATPLLASENWPQFRGPGAAGTSPTPVPTVLGADSLAWRAEPPGSGHSSPIVWDGQVIITTTLPDGDARAIIAYDLASGEQRWQVTYPFSTFHIHAAFNSYSSTTPVADAAGIYFQWPDGNSVISLSLDHQGEERWLRKDEGFDHTDHGMVASPVLAEGTLVLSQDHIGAGAALLGLDPATGAERWRIPRKNTKDAYSTPVVIPASDTSSQVVFSSMDHGFLSLDPATGDALWTFNPGYKMRAVGSPTFAQGLLVATFGQGASGQESAVLRPGDASRPPQLAFELDKGMPYVPTPLILDGRIYLLQDSGMLTCVNLEDGETLFDRERIGEAGAAKWFASPVAAGDVIYCASQRGEVVAIRAGDQLKVIATSLLGTAINATPALVDGTILIRTEDALLAFRR
jgi:outer membrane protein assembly factor BamB